jgi:hypothetical protein
MKLFHNKFSTDGKCHLLPILYLAVSNLADAFTTLSKMFPDRDIYFADLPAGWCRKSKAIAIGYLE